MSLATVLVHVLVSWIGFNPTDEGFTLAYSRRIAAGEIPHRDFIIIRPFLSPLLHVPELLAGSYTFWVSRLVVWCQLAAVASVWTELLGRWSFEPREVGRKLLLGSVVFCLTVHSFPIMAWHTIDGLFLASVGLALVLGGGSKRRFAGLSLIGLAYLCKQSFLLVGPAVVLLSGGRRRPGEWLAVSWPAAAYLLYLALNGALPDAVIQLGAQRDGFSAGVESYWTVFTGLGLLAGLAGARLLPAGSGSPLARSSSARRRVVLGATTLFFLPAVVGAASLALDWLRPTSFGLFGMVAGVAVGLVARREESADETRRRDRFSRLAALALLFAWSASLSIGYNTPALGSGILLGFLAAFSLSALRPSLPRVASWSLGALGLLVMAGFGYTRYHHVYRDRTPPELTFSVGRVLAGGHWIRTNEDTFDFLRDLEGAVALARDRAKSYAILPDLAAYWVQSPDSNPLPIDWVQATELSRDALVARVVGDLEDRRPHLVIIVQKLSAEHLAVGGTPIEVDDFHAIAGHVTRNFTKVAETRHFELYR